MLGRFLILRIGILASAMIAAPAWAKDGAPPPAEHLRLSCTGMMVTADYGPPGSKIMADGAIDLATMRVRGFGLGSVPIVLLTATRIVFDNGTGQRDVPTTIEGSIDRTTGATRVVVHAAKDPKVDLIAMTLDCRFAPAVS
jgi:hypothetical protein